MDDSLSVVAIPADQFPAWKDGLEWHIGSFCERSGGSLTASALTASIEAEEYQVWAVVSPDAIKACALTYILPDATKT